MAVGPAGSFNDTNVRQQNDGGVSPKQVEEFKEAVRSNTSSDASGTQSAKGRHPSAHSQDASKAFALILATRPPINLGNPIGKQGAPQNRPQAQRTMSSAQTPSGGTQGTMSSSEDVASNFQEVEDLGARIANSEGPVTDADRTEWMQAQQELQQSITDYAGEISQLPLDSPDRAAAMEEMARRSDKLTAQELPVLARFDKGFGESWNHFHDKKPGSEGAVLQTRMKMYGITDEQMNRYIATGQEPDGLKKAVNEARRSGEWPALGVVRASYQMRADYLRATTGSDDAASRKQADQLDAASASLTNNRNAIHMNWGSEKYSKLSQKYPDDTNRPANVQKQMDEAKQAIASVRARVVDQVTAHPERYGKNSPTRQLAGDALTTEARIAGSEAKAKMAREAKANVESTAQQNKTLKPDQQPVVPAPPKLHPDLVEGGVVDQKRSAAVKIDPSLGDVVHGGDRALQFHREGMDTKKLRLNVNEQQVAHLNSKGQRPPAELVAKTNTQVEEIFKNTLETNEKLTRQKPASLSVNQTALLAELDGDATTYAAKISSTAHQKSQIEMDSRLKDRSQESIQRGRDELDKAYGDFDKVKRDRIEADVQKKLAFRRISMEEYAEFQKDPAAYAKKQPDSTEEAKLRSELDAAKAEGDKLLATAKTNAANAKQVLEYSKKIDDLDGLNTSPDMATGLAKDALARSEAHMKAIPTSGPERLPRLQAAADHQSAVIGLSTVIRDNADARIARHALGHNEVEIAYGNQPAPMIDDPVGRSAENLAKVTAEETETKRGALKDAKNAVSESDQIRKDIGIELDKAQATLPKAVREQRAADVQAYKDTLALQEVRSYGVVAQLGADIDPKAAREQLEQGSRIINDEMPYTHVSRIDKQQAAMQHSRNEIRAQALADHGDASLAVAQRAQFTGGTEYGMLVVDALATAHKSAGALKETLTIDGGGAAANTANKKLHEELTKRADATVKDALEIDKSADVLKLADSIDNELAKDVGEFNKLQGELGKAVKDQRGDAFGYFANGVARIRGAIDGQGGDLNKIGLEIGNEYLRLGSSKGRMQATELTRTAQALREMHASGIPDHVIMASLRDPRFAELHPKFFNQDTFEQARADNKKMFEEISGQIKGRYGANLVDEKFLGAGYGIRDTQLGKVFDSARSNRTDNIVTYLGNKNTDLLKEGKAELREYADMANRDWQKVAPYAVASQVVDQVVITMVSGAALAGVFARAASLTRIPQAFSAARGLAVGMSAPARLAVLAGVNASEAGLGMLTGAAMGKVGEGIFGEGTTGAKMFGYIGGGFQLSNASKVAMRSGLAFQAAMGLTLGGVPIVAQQLGASSDLAEKIGMASGIFMPTVLGTMSNRNTLKRAEHVMVNELGLDPTKARGLMGELFHAESTMDPRFVKDGAFNVEGFTRDRAAKLVDQKFPGLGENARTQILDNATVDAARRRISLEPPKNAGVREQVQYIDEFHGRLESELVKMGVKSDRARELAQSEKTEMYDQALAATNAREKGAEGAPDGGGSDPNTPTGAGAATRHKVEALMRGTNQDVQLLNGKPSDLPLKLVAMDKANDKALVKFPDGSMQQVKASEVVYVHEGQALGNLPPAVQKSFDDRFGRLADDQKQQWKGMEEEARKRSPEHVSVLRKMMAGGASMDEIRDMHQRTLNLSHEEIGKYFSPGNLPQHLEKSCVAACIQQIEGSLNPPAGHKLKDPAEQMRGQIDIMMRMDGGSKPRTDKAYPLDAPPITDQKWVPARPYEWPDAMPPALKTVLKQENRWDSYHKFDVNMQLDRRYLPQQLAEIASQGPAYVNGIGNDRRQVVYELTGTRHGANGDEISVRTPGDKNETWWKISDLAPGKDGRISLPDGTVLTHVAVPPNQPLRAADLGLQLHEDTDIQNKIRAATGKELKRFRVEDGDAALRAIHDSVKEIGVAGVVVEWKGRKVEDGVSHQLLIKGAHDLGGGNYTFVVFEPWTGKTRTVSGEALKSRYTSGAPGGSEGSMKFVQVPEDMTLGKTSRVDKREALARNQIEMHQRQKLPELATIEKITDPESRSIQTQMLLHSGSVDGMKSVLTSNVPALQNVDAHALESLINIYRANPTPEARGALIRLMPVLGRLPEGARNHALEQLNSMRPQDLQRTAQRLADSPVAWMSANDAGAAGNVAASDAAKPKAPSGGDVADTIRMQKARGGEGSGPSDPTPPKPDLGVPTYGNLTDRVPAGGQRVQIIEKDGKYFERDYETGALTQASGEYAFARMPDGSLWASQYGHAEASMGGRVAYAGQVKFENGALKEWSGASGTYKPVGGDFANQAGFKTPPQPIPPHPGKKVQLPVFQEPPGSVIIPAKVDKSLHAPGASEHDAMQKQSLSGPKPTETPRDLYGEAMKRLPEAQERLAASKAQRGIPDHMLGMATPGGPPSSPRRRVIDQLLAEPTLELEETRGLMRMIFDEHPVLNDLTAVQGAPAGPGLRAQLDGIMQRFAQEVGVSITVVPDGAVRAVRGPRDFGSMRSRPGHYEIEQSVYNDDVRLRKELTHQITAYLGSRGTYESPISGPRNAAEWLESCVEQGGPPGVE